MSAAPLLTLSIVSHAQGLLVADLLADIAAVGAEDISVVLTLNIAEELSFDEKRWPFPLHILRNDIPRGFGANHNAAFAACDSDYFCVLNPDLRLREGNPFPALIAECARTSVGVVAPLIVDDAGNCEDSARRYPTAFSLLRKALTRGRRLDYGVPQAAFSPDWVAGMFMLLRSDAFAAVRGFDERYFLYYEDVDLCRRLRRFGWDIRQLPQVRVTHLARRQSRRDARYLRWHLASMLRYFRS